MKPHLEVRLRAGVAPPEAPYWVDVIRDRSLSTERFHPEVDRVLSKHRVPVWVTRAYPPQGGGAWSPEELAAGLDRVYRLVLQESRTIPPSLLDDIRLVPIVEWVRMGQVGQAELPAARPAAMSATTDQESRDAIGLERAHALTRGDEGVTVAVLDTGIWLRHPELRHAMLPGFDFVDIIDGATEFLGDYVGADDDATDEVGHGTHVAGIIAGAGSRMPAGVAPKVKILPVRVLGALKQGEKRVGAGLLDNINAAVKWAVDQGATVINMSLGVRHTGGGLPHAEVVDYAKKKGVTIVAASGNDGREERYYPGALPHVIAVGAAERDGRVAPFSTWGDQVSLVAPGTEIYSTFLDDGYAFSSGTSHAAPFVAGAAALLQSYARQTRGARLGDGQVKHVLKHTADRPDGRFKTRKTGFGMLNLADALRLLDHKLDQMESRHAA
ncbi:MAG TPA: S8 family serine peptidase [Longimicrobium sp.]|nr:S8 family serine peptidase [Longimicrobium sp.]